MSAQLRDIPGPSALGGGRRRSLELLYLISITDFKRAYFGTLLGYLWSIARPLMLFGVLVAVFTQIFRLGSEPCHTIQVLLLFNIVLFGFFQEASGAAVTSLVAQESVCERRSSLGPWCRWSTVLTSLMDLAVDLVAVLVFLLAFGVESDVDLARLPADPGRLSPSLTPSRCSLIVSALYPALPRRGDHLVGRLRRSCSTRARCCIRSTRSRSRCVDIFMLNPLAPLLLELGAPLDHRPRGCRDRWRLPAVAVGVLRAGRRLRGRVPARGVAVRA